MVLYDRGAAIQASSTRRGNSFVAHASMLKDYGESVCLADLERFAGRATSDARIRIENDIDNLIGVAEFSAMRVRSVVSVRNVRVSFPGESRYSCRPFLRPRPLHSQSRRRRF